MRSAPLFKTMLVVPLLVACSTSFERLPDVDVDYVFWQGQVYTLNREAPWAEAVAVSNGQIVYVGSNHGARAFIGEDTEVIHLGGKMLLPGFIDTHAHPMMAAGMSEVLRLDTDGTPEQWSRAVAEYARENPELTHIYGFGFAAHVFGPSGPTKEMLDAVVDDRPVLLIDDGGHSAWVNTKTFEFAGIDKNTPDPIPGVHYYHRDAAGEPTGWCLEPLTFNPIAAELGVLTSASVVEGAGELFWLMTSFGITSVYDAGMSSFEDDAYEGLAELDRNGQLPTRMVTSHMVQSPKQVAGAVDRLKFLADTYSSDLVKPRVIKIHNDGTKEAFTAALFEDYANQEGNRGAILLEGKTLQDFVVEVDRAGFDVHIHGIGDRAVAEALDAFQAARVANPTSAGRYTIAHAEIVRDQDLPRFRKLNVTAQTTPFWFVTDGVSETKALGPVRAAKLLRFKQIERFGGRVSFGSDFPVTGALVGLSPLYNIEMGITRQPYGERNAPVAPPQDARLSLETMIEGYTLAAAYQLNMDREVGSIEEGKLADLIVLDKNLFDIDTYDIHKVKVEMTMMNGEVTYERGFRTFVAEFMLGI